MESSNTTPGASSAREDDRFTWEEGDVQIYDSLEALKRDCEANGEKFIQPQKRRLKKEDRETE